MNKMKLRAKITMQYFVTALCLNKLATGIDNERFFNEYLENRKVLDDLIKELKQLKKGEM